ncbi:MAG: ABC transporter ATP-binding protein [Blastocatellia bacterium]|nr:ABC transporter ATP-binding protein [Blastocatellia bacterium]MCS7157498.1 ABC transporter ATP-binding protein [Blastocatellia bacterium]MCX7752671.1 ABC transporter ATP-binding protein [Blastocatellia bacterium]MDW8168402.1 ABC transporter ATP-binding protein [Acidobacteriota bacterium]MDW8255598.1 ABC transporter ATP-binding protein [Acidobacteriota bacterium]
MSGDLVLEVRDLRAYFFTDRGLVRAVDGVSFSIARGRTLGLVGESGCGKSVTALSLMRLVPPPGRIVGGEILFEGRNLCELEEEEMRRLRGARMAMIFQDPMSALNPVLTAGFQIAEAVLAHERISRREAFERAIEMMRAVAIPDPERRARSYPHELSGGLRQRVLIAMALVCRPALLIADEPTTALDVTIQAEILDLLARLREEFRLAMLLITHDLGIVAQTADDVAVMYAGRIVEYAPVREIFYNPQHPYTRGLLRCVPRLMASGEGRHRLETIEGTVPNLWDLPPGCPFADRCPEAQPICREGDVEMIEIAPAHFVRCVARGSPIRSAAVRIAQDVAPGGERSR